MKEAMGFVQQHLPGGHHHHDKAQDEAGGTEDKKSKKEAMREAMKLAKNKGKSNLITPYILWTISRYQSD